MMTSLPTRCVLLTALLSLAACSGPESPAPNATDASSESAARRLPADGLVQPQDLARYTALPEPPLLLDVRTVAENTAARIPGSILIPVQDLPKRMTELHAGREQGVIIYCRSGRRARNAQAMLERSGFTDLALLDGSMQRWEREGRPVERGAPAESLPAVPSP